MKNMKRILTVLLMCCMVMTALSANVLAASVVESGEWNDGCKYSIYSDRTMIVTSEDGIVGSVYGAIMAEAPWSETSDVAPVSKLVLLEGCTEIRSYCFGGVAFTDLQEICLPKSLTKINNNAFLSASKITDIYYAGNKNEWGAISIGTGNDYLKNATIHYNSDSLPIIDIEDRPSSAETPEHVTIPPIGIADFDGNLLTDRTYSLGLEQKCNLAVALDSSIWQKDTKWVGNKEMTAFFSQDSLGNYIYLQAGGIDWKLTGNTGCVSVDSMSSGILALSGVHTGFVTVTANVPCGYAVQVQDMLADQGIVGIASVSTVIEVKASSAYHNPFSGIDPDAMENPFEDVPSNAWYYRYACTLYAAGFYQGVDTSSRFDGSSILGKPASSIGMSASLGSSASGSAALSGNTASFGNTTSSGSAASSGGQTSSSAGKVRFNGSGMENRANTVVVMYNGHGAIGGSVGSYTSNPFKDVGSGKTYYQPILWASANSIVNGYGNGKFGPADGITREQFCAILLRYANYAGITLPSDQTAKTFTDNGKISSWAKDAVLACQKAGIINGYPDGSFKPQAGITRAEVSKMIYEFYNLLT